MKISFVIPAYNSDTWLPHAVGSCQAQSYKDIEIVIVNDGSTDTTLQYLEWLQKQGDSRIKVINTPNKGRSSARNTGNEAASGDVICVLDADDLSGPNRAKLTAAKFTRGVEFVYGSMETTDAVGMIRGKLIADVLKKEDVFKTKLTHIVHSSVAYTKKFAMDFPYRLGEVADLGIDDWDQQIRALFNNVKMDFILSPIGFYRLLDTSTVSRRNQAKVNALKDNIMSEFGVAA